ncbi:sodium:solute symporter family transporter, partial [Salmonella enterica]|uniref:sodium:solute symporter family transporter n=1 Tax=Salmonella enterica TaxID=28901 RepID=UPI00398C6F08
MQSPLSSLSFALRLIFPTSSLPLILLRFFTVLDAREARKRLFSATPFMGYFYLLTFILRLAPIMLLSANPASQYAARALICGNNIAAVPLAHTLRGNLFPGFISAAALASIPAVVPGFPMAVSSPGSHNLFAI